MSRDDAEYDDGDAIWLAGIRTNEDRPGNERLRTMAGKTASPCARRPSFEALLDDTQQFCLFPGNILPLDAGMA